MSIQKWELLFRWLQKMKPSWGSALKSAEPLKLKKKKLKKKCNKCRLLTRPSGLRGSVCQPSRGFSSRARGRNEQMVAISSRVWMEKEQEKPEVRAAQHVC